jgi:hypothetical protein
VINSSSRSSEIYPVYQYLVKHAPCTASGFRFDFFSNSADSLRFATHFEAEPVSGRHVDTAEEIGLLRP